MSLQAIGAGLDTAESNISTLQSDVSTEQSAPVFRAHLHTQHNGTGSAYALIQFDTVDFDTGSYWDATNHRYTPQRAGYYRTGWSAFGGRSTSLTRCLAGMFKNGTEVSVGSDGAIPSGGDTGISTGSDLVYLNGSTDYIDIRAYLVATGTPIIGITGVDYLCYFSVNWLRA